MASQAHTNSSAPICLKGLFVDSDDSDQDNSTADGGSGESTSGAGGFKQEYEIQDKLIVDKTIKIRQFSWHQANANQVWAGAFDLCAFINRNRSRYCMTLDGASEGRQAAFLELGAATGAAAIYLSLPQVSTGSEDVDSTTSQATLPPFNMITSDIDDGGEVEDNIRFNFLLNGLSPCLHVPFTWGQNWDDSLERAISKRRTTNAGDKHVDDDGGGGESVFRNDSSSSSSNNFNSNNSNSNSNSIRSISSGSTDSDLCQDIRFIIASDILIYVSAYQHLVDSLLILFKKYSIVEFILSHKRRIADGKIFFDMMTSAGFECERTDSCIYIFRLP